MSSTFSTPDPYLIKSNPLGFLPGTPHTILTPNPDFPFVKPWQQRIRPMPVIKFNSFSAYMEDKERTMRELKCIGTSIFPPAITAPIAFTQCTLLAAGVTTGIVGLVSVVVGTIFCCCKKPQDEYELLA